MEEIIPKNTSFKDFEIEYEFPKIGHITMLLNARCIPAAGKRPSLILLAIEDITDAKKKERQYQDTLTRLEKQVEELKGKEQKRPA